MTFDTVDIETPAVRATSLIVAICEDTSLRQNYDIWAAAQPVFINIIPWSIMIFDMLFGLYGISISLFYMYFQIFLAIPAVPRVFQSSGEPEKAFNALK
jgi:hypothetical protein